LLKNVTYPYKEYYKEETRRSDLKTATVKGNNKSAEEHPDSKPSINNKMITKQAVDDIPLTNTRTDANTRIDNNPNTMRFTIYN
jgi:hypothetical protein